MTAFGEGRCRRGAGLSLLSAILALVVGTATSATGDDTVYRWTDRQGTVHYSDTPPTDIPAQVIDPSPPPPSGDDSAQRLREFVKKSDAEAAARDAKAAAARKLEADAAQRLAACEEARRSRARIEARPRILQIEPDGSARRLTEEERQARLAELDRTIATCPVQ